MSKQASVEFFTKLYSDAALQQEVTKAIEGQGNEPMLMEAARCIAEVGRKYGYDFIPEEAAETYLAIMEMQNQQIQGLTEDEQELNDQELDMVAGGTRKVKSLKQETVLSVDFDRQAWDKANASVVDKGKALNTMGMRMASQAVSEGRAVSCTFVGFQDSDTMIFKGIWG